jgi:type III secretory pathway component EscU
MVTILFLDNVDYFAVLKKSIVTILFFFIIKIYCVNLKGISVANDYECVPVVVSNIRSIIYSWLVIGHVFSILSFILTKYHYILLTDYPGIQFHRYIS